MTSSEKKKKPPEAIGPTYQRAPKEGTLCYELLINEYLGQWLIAKTITPGFYDLATKELAELKKTKYGKEITAKKVAVNPAEVEEVENFLSTLPKTDRTRSGECKGKTRPQPEMPNMVQRPKKGRGESSVSIAEHEKTEQRLGFQIIDLQNKNRDLQKEIERLNGEVAWNYVENRQLEQKYKSVQKQLVSARETIQEPTLRVSTMAGDNIRHGNPNLADLSDPYRPTQLGKMFAEIYDNEWSDAYEEVKGAEKHRIKILREIMLDSYKFCAEMLEKQQKIIESCLVNPAKKDQVSNNDAESKAVRDSQFQNVLKDKRKQLAPNTAKHLAEMFTLNESPMKLGSVSCSEILPLLSKYANKCTELCWFMVICDPPLVFSEDKAGTEFNSSIYRPYSRSQKDIKTPVIEMTVWPALYLHLGGALLSKGVAQPINDKDFLSQKLS